MADRLPKEVLSRPKQGFGIPIDDWLRGPLAELCSDTLSTERARRRGLFDVHAVDQLLTEHRMGTGNHGRRLWMLLQFELWLQRWIDRSPAAMPDAVQVSSA
jgi:asparagine synthase (glutamine-hydrolysing)